ncbi:MAG: histidinol phosphate phosphatase domain-containing protein [Elusimicrobia bacterium]|nr:histidinol phosphate phosphatase domain-containing protein [Elusimicrobiota bacterium]
MKYIDLHTHSLFSDGALLPSELVYRAKVNGYEAIALTDHGDFSTIDYIIPRIKKITAQLSRAYDIRVLAGIEITYVPPPLIAKAVQMCRKLGADIVVVHGETPAETVPPGTNHAAIMACADIIAHPGHITADDVLLARKNNVCLEITTRRGHKAGNPHVARLAKKLGASLVFNTDTHQPDDLMCAESIRSTLKVSGLVMADFLTMQNHARGIINGRKYSTQSKKK